MATPPVEQRGTCDRGTGAIGTASGAVPKANAPSNVPESTTALIGNCYEFITINEERSNPRKGTGVHRVIREQMVTYLRAQGYESSLKITLPDASFNHYRNKNNLLLGRGEKSGNGYVDIAVRSRSGAVMLLAEIKPANWSMLEGEAQLDNYINKANANENIKREWNVRFFSPLRPLDAILPPEIIYQSRRFEIRWCRPGIIVYKEIEKKEEDKKNRKKESPRSVAELVAEGKPWQEYVYPIRSRSASPAMKFEAWVPEALRNDILANNIPEGVYRNRYQAAWPSGYTSNVVVWNKRGPFGREYQFYQEFPTDPAFYEYLTQKKGLSQWQGELVRSTLIEYNDDLWSLISPKGAVSSMSPYYARDELRTIYAEVLKGVVGGSAQIVASGAAITGIANAMRQRATSSRSLDNEATSGTRDEPLPDWVMKAIEKGSKATRKHRTPDWEKAIDKGFEAARKQLTTEVKP